MLNKIVTLGLLQKKKKVISEMMWDAIGTNIVKIWELEQLDTSLKWIGLLYMCDKDTIPSKQLYFNVLPNVHC